jgi:intein/homing endonuclease
MDTAKPRVDARFSPKLNGNGNGSTNGNGHKSNALDLNAPVTMPVTIVKRDGRVMPFETERIENALARCFASFGRTPTIAIGDLAKQVGNIVAAKYDEPNVENVQDIVEMVLQAAGEFEAAKRYILYRAEHAKLRAERPIPEGVRAAFEESDRYFPTDLQKFQFYDKYSRFNYDYGRRETWIETVDRSVDFMHELAGDRLPAETYGRIRRGILEMRAMPSMRLLAMAGPAARRNNITIYNCSYMPVESIDAFVESLIISMSGCGVGYSVERKYVENFPRIKRQTGKPATVYFVEDSAEGWADALRFGLETWFDGGDVRFDLGLLRPAGAPLRTKGGRASGPEPLRKMFEFIRTRVLARQGSFLRSIDAHDIMCAVGNAAVSGGVRRTAMISLFDYDDAEMLHAKDGDFERENSQRWNANNSVVLPRGGLTQIEFAKFFLDMAQGGRGEPGIFNRESAMSLKPERRKEAEFGTNPCVTGETWVMTTQGARRVGELVNLAHWTVVDGEPFKTTDAGFWKTGEKPVLVLQTKEGYALRLTENHKVRVVTYRSRKIEHHEWREAGALKVGDEIKLNDHRGLEWGGNGSFDEGWLLGSLVGDGTVSSKEGQEGQTLTSAHLDYWGEHRAVMSEAAHEKLRRTVKVRSDNTGVEYAPAQKIRLASTGLAALAHSYGIHQNAKTVGDAIERASSEFYRGFLQGLFDSDGTVLGNLQKGVSIRLTQSNKETLRAVQRMLLRLGILSTLYQNRRDAQYRIMPDGRGGHKEYLTQAYHELVISNDNIQVYAEVVGFSDPGKRARLDEILSTYHRIPNRERFSATIESIKTDGVEEVYDCAVPGPNAFDANGFVAHNCGEIVLRPFEFCNLSIAVARHEDTFESLKEKVELATLIGTIQSLATHFPGLRKQWQENCEEERLLGVDITGQMDSPAAQDVNSQRQLRELAIETNRLTAAQLGINQSVSVTCVKPSGNSSQLLNCSSGLHTRWSPYYIRNVRVATHSPIYKVMRDAGAPMDPENGQTPEDANTWVIHFPVKAPDGAITRKDRTAIQQCEYWLQNKLNWTEHNPSVTISYQPHEVLDLMKWVYEHIEYLGGITFLPAFDAMYDQMPYMEIDATEHAKLQEHFPAIDFSKLYRYEEEDLTTAAQELACLAGACDVDFAGKPDGQ